jgi:transposase
MPELSRKPYPSDVSDEEWALVAPYLTLLPEDSRQRRHPLREVFNALRWMVRAGAPWRLIPHEFPPWAAVHQQAQRWIAAGVFEALVHDLRAVLRLAEDRAPQPSAIVLDARTLQSSCESGGRAGYDGAKRRRGSKVHMAVDTLGQLLALRVTPASEDDRAQVGEVVQAVQALTGDQVELAYVDQGYTGSSGRGGRRRARREAGGGQTAARQAGFCALAAPVGGGALLRLDGAVSALGARLRAAAHDLGGPALYRLRLLAVGSRHLAFSDLLVHDTV